MREKSNKFRKGQGKRKKSVALKKDDISWLSKNTHFDPDTVTEWHKVRKIFRKHNRYVLYQKVAQLNEQWHSIQIR